MPPRKTPGPNWGPVRAGLEATLAGQAPTADHAALVAAARAMADALDADPSVAALWREFRLTVRDVIGAGSDDAPPALSDWRTPRLRDAS